MAYRCINAFAAGDRIVAGGAVVEADDPILATHGAHFVKVDAAPSPAGSETASADRPRPATKRAAAKKASAKPAAEDLDAE